MLYGGGGIIEGGVSVFEFKPAGVECACVITESVARVAGRWRGEQDKSLCTM